MGEMIATMRTGRFFVLVFSLFLSSFVLMQWTLIDSGARVEIAAPAPAPVKPAAPSVSGADLVVDHASYIGKRVTITGRPFDASELQALLNVRGVTFVLVDPAPETRRVLIAQCHVTDSHLCPAMTFEVTVTPQTYGRSIVLTGARLI